MGIWMGDGWMERMERMESRSVIYSTLPRVHSYTDDYYRILFHNWRNDTLLYSDQSLDHGTESHLAILRVFPHIILAKRGGDKLQLDSSSPEKPNLPSVEWL